MDKNKASKEVFSLKHNALSFLSLKISLCAEGDGEIIYNNFICKPIKQGVLI